MWGSSSPMLRSVWADNNQLDDVQVDLQVAGSVASSLLYLLTLLGGPVLLIISVISISNSLARDPKGVIFPLALAIFTGIIGAILLMAVVAIETRSRTVLLTATRTEAPTWWQEYRGHIAIAVIFGAVCFFLGFTVR
jgi:hypothetical protein